MINLILLVPGNSNFTVTVTVMLFMIWLLSFQLTGQEAQRLAMSVLRVMNTVLSGSVNAKVGMIMPSQYVCKSEILATRNKKKLYHYNVWVCQRKDGYDIVLLLYKQYNYEIFLTRNMMKINCDMNLEFNLIEYIY